MVPLTFVHQRCRATRTLHVSIRVSMLPDVPLTLPHLGGPQLFPLPLSTLLQAHVFVSRMKRSSNCCTEFQPPQRYSASFTTTVCAVKTVTTVTMVTMVKTATIVTMVTITMVIIMLEIPPRKRTIITGPARWLSLVKAMRSLILPLDSNRISLPFTILVYPSPPPSTAI